MNKIDHRVSLPPQEDVAKIKGAARRTIKGFDNTLLREKDRMGGIENQSVLSFKSPPPLVSPEIRDF
jgi:hypothetical protein